MLLLLSRVLATCHLVLWLIWGNLAFYTIHRSSFLCYPQIFKVFGYFVVSVKESWGLKRSLLAHVWLAQCVNFQLPCPVSRGYAADIVVRWAPYHSPLLNLDQYSSVSKISHRLKWRYTRPVVIYLISFSETVVNPTTRIRNSFPVLIRPSHKSRSLLISVYFSHMVNWISKKLLTVYMTTWHQD